MTVEATVERCKGIINDPKFKAVHEWKARNPGKKAGGMFPVFAPMELIHAAGMLPVGIIGGGNQVEIAHADARFQSFVCSIIKSTMELGMTGELDVLDFMILSNICDPARNLASILKRNFPHMTVEYLHLTQNLGSPRAEEFLAAEFRRVATSVGNVSGTPVTEENLRASIKTWNHFRGLVRSLYRTRMETPHLLSAAESYALVRAGTYLPVEEHVKTLEEVLHQIPFRTAKPKDRIRVIVEGSFCEQPPVELISQLEEAGCYVVGDDFLLGWRWYTEDVEDDGDPYRALARAYIDRSEFASVKHDIREPKVAHLLRKVKETRADAVVILAAKFCEPALFDYAMYREGLEKAGIPHVSLEFEEKMWMFDKIQTEIETFVESMLFD